MKKLSTITCMLAFLTACAPEVGSDDWCEALKEKPKTEWTADEAKGFAKHCIF